MGALSTAGANALLDAFVQNVAIYVKLHTGDPGAAGTSNAATETTRQVVASWAAASSGSVATDADVVWTNLAATESITHVSFWSASSGGTFYGSDDLAVQADVTATGALTIPAGVLTFSWS